MIDNVLELIIEDPSNYNIIVDDGQVTVYDKSNGDTHRFDDGAENVLVNLLNVMGAEAECV